MNSQEKIKTREALVKIITPLKRRGKTIAFTNGCFDLMHRGHVEYLEKAKGTHPNRFLIVGLNSDKSIRAIKEPGRPILDQKARARVLAALACVDYVTIFDEETPQELIERLQPDILIKGADWKGKIVVGADLVQSYGGRVEFMPYIAGVSTTGIVAAILRKFKKSCDWVTRAPVTKSPVRKYFQ